MTGPRLTFRSRSCMLSLLAALPLATLGCGAEDGATTSGSPSGAGPGAGGSSGQGGQGGEDGTGGSESGDDVLEGPCARGAIRECTVHNDAGCATGTQRCSEGVWSPCYADGTGENANRNRALGDLPSECGTDGTTENLCDTACQGFLPDPPIFDDGGGISFDYETGSIGSLPSGAINAGLDEPCNDDRDCQFDFYCDEATSQCEPYIPGQYNSACGFDYDVSVGIPCGGTVPVCNRGNVDIPAATLSTFEIKYQAPPPYMMDGCSIGGSSSCPIVAIDDLEPGDCVNLPCVMPDDVVVYVDAGAGNSDECECGNNWSYNTNDACGDPSCGGSVSAASQVPLVLFLAIDTSGSMDYDLVNTNSDNDDESPSRWEAVHPALEAFVEAEESAGIGIVVRYWPTGDCDADECTAVGSFGDSVTGTCAFSPCEEQSSGVLDPACNADVATVCSDEEDARCCGDLPIGSCATSPCVTSVSPLIDNCIDGVEEVCDSNSYKRCCGQWEGDCGTNPCQAQASGVDLGGCNDDDNSQIEDVCNDSGFAYCCAELPDNDDVAWGATINACSTNGSGMRCRDDDGDAIDCEDQTPTATDSLSHHLKNFCAIPANSTCCRNDADSGEAWTGTCRTNFRTYWNGLHAGIDLCSTSTHEWNATCVARYVSKDANSCDFRWDADCVDEYLDQEGGNACDLVWDDDCVDEFNDVSDDACDDSSEDGCNIPSVPSSCTDEGTCPIYLTADPAPTDATEAALVASFNAVNPNNGTPSRAALEGAGDFCLNYQSQRPGERCVVVFVSDGQPSACGDQGDVIDVATTAYDGGDGVFVYTISIPGGDVDFMDDVADAGGTDASFEVTADGSATADFLDAMESIRNEFACSYAVADGTDPATVNVNWNDGPTTTELVDVGSSAGCGTPNGYWFETPTEIRLCPGAGNTCETVRAATGSNIEISVECEPSDPVVLTFTDTFSAAGFCTALGTYPKWTVLYHSAVIVDTSSILVEARTRATAADPWRELHEIVEITSANAISDAADPPSIQDPLGAEAWAEEIELQFTVDLDLVPPVLLSYEVHFTCADSE